MQFINPSNYTPYAPEGLVGRPDGRLDHLLHLHRLRFGLDRRRGGEEPAPRPPDRHHRDIGGLHRPLHCRRRGAYRDDAVATLEGDPAPVVNTPEESRPCDRFHDDPLGSFGGAVRGHDGDDFVAAGLPTRAGAGLVLDVTRRIAATLLRQGAPEVPHARQLRRGSPDSWWAFPLGSSTSGRWRTSRTSGRYSRSCWSRPGDHSALPRTRAAVAASAPQAV